MNTNKVILHPIREEEWPSLMTSAITQYNYMLSTSVNSPRCIANRPTPSGDMCQSNHSYNQRVVTVVQEYIGTVLCSCYTEIAAAFTVVLFYVRQSKESTVQSVLTFTLLMLLTGYECHTGQRELVTLLALPNILVTILVTVRGILGFLITS